MLDRLTGGLDFQSEALLLRAERQRLLASNIANAETPGFVAREIDFATTLLQATQAAQPHGARVVATTSAPRHLVAGAGRQPLQLQYAQPAQASIDGNTVDLDRERASFADNAVRYEATLRFINGSVRTMLSAITGQ